MIASLTTQQIKPSLIQGPSKAPFACRALRSHAFDQTILGIREDRASNRSTIQSVDSSFENRMGAADNPKARLACQTGRQRHCFPPSQVSAAWAARFPERMSIDAEAAIARVLWHS